MGAHIDDHGCFALRYRDRYFDILVLAEKRFELRPPASTSVTQATQPWTGSTRPLAKPIPHTRTRRRRRRLA